MLVTAEVSSGQFIDSSGAMLDTHGSHHADIFGPLSADGTSLPWA